jgi:hypothetical protein
LKQGRPPSGVMSHQYKWRHGSGIRLGVEFAGDGHIPSVGASLTSSIKSRCGTSTLPSCARMVMTGLESPPEWRKTSLKVASVATLPSPLGLKSGKYLPTGSDQSNLPSSTRMPMDADTKALEMEHSVYNVSSFGGVRCASRGSRDPRPRVRRALPWCRTPSEMDGTWQIFLTSSTLPKAPKILWRVASLRGVSLWVAS